MTTEKLEIAQKIQSRIRALNADKKNLTQPQYQPRLVMKCHANVYPIDTIPEPILETMHQLALATIDREIAKLEQAFDNL